MFKTTTSSSTKGFRPKERIAPIFSLPSGIPRLLVETFVPATQDVGLASDYLDVISQGTSISRKEDFVMPAELAFFENGIEKHNTRMLEAIEADGIYVKFNNGLSYTVGMSKIGLPELMVRGSDEEQNKELIFGVFYAARNQVLQLEPGSVEGLFFADGLALAAVSEFEKRSVFYGARTLYNSWDFEALQLVNNGGSNV